MEVALPLPFLMTPSRTHEAAEKLLGNASFHVGRELRWVTGMAAARGGGARAPIHVYAGVEFLDMIAELVSPFESAHATTKNAGGTTTVKTAEERRGDLADATLSLHSEPTVVNVLFCADPNGAARRGGCNKDDYSIMRPAGAAALPTYFLERAHFSSPISVLLREEIAASHGGKN